MEARFNTYSKKNGRRSTARWSLMGLVFGLAVCLVAVFDLASKAQASPLLQISTESPTPSPTSTPLVVSSADSETLPTWTSTPTPRRATALAMTLQAQLDLTQTRVPPTPSSIYTITRTPTVTTTYFYKIFPSVTLRKWPTYTFTPRPTLTSIPTQDQRQTLESIRKKTDAELKYEEQFTVTAEADNYIAVANVSDSNHSIQPTIVWTASPGMPLWVNTTWLPDGSGILLQGGLYDSRRFYTLQLTGGEPVRVKGQNLQQLNDNPPLNNKDNIQPALSPDGQWIAFSSIPVDDRAHHHLFIMKADGSKLYQLTNGLYKEELQPSWSPDSKSIFFISGFGSANSSAYYRDYLSYAQLFKLDFVKWLATSSHKAVDMDGANPFIDDPSINYETAPRYCMVKNNPWIVFSENVGSRQIYVMNANGDNGTNIINLTTVHGNSFPDWSPDCKKIIYTQDDGETQDIYILNISWTDDDTPIPSVDGDPQLLFHNKNGVVSSPHFSLDGSHVVFVHTFPNLPLPTRTPTPP
jgi:Tol biopolymer transport system component